jgi:hypothetical protein
MTWVATAIAVSAGVNYLGARGQAKAAQSAAGMQSDAAMYAAQQQREMAEKSLGFQREVYEKGLELGAPYREAGYGALTRIDELLPGLTKPVSREEILGLPGYQFAIEQGTGAARQNVNVGGGGSNVDRAAQKFATDYTLSTAMPQVIAQRQNIYNTLAGIAGIGQTGAGQGISAGNQFATGVGTTLGNAAGNIGQAAIGGASAIGAGQVGAANAYANAYGNIGNSAMMYALMNRP